MTKKVKIITCGKAHGVRGEIRVKIALEDIDILADLMPLQDKKGQNFTLKNLRLQGEHYIAHFEHISNRNEAEALRNTILYTEFSRLPSLENDEFYYHDLIGLEVRDALSHEILGHILRLVDFGAGDLLDIAFEGESQSQLLPFTKAHFPEINIDKGYVTLQKDDI